MRVALDRGHGDTVTDVHTRVRTHAVLVKNLITVVLGTCEHRLCAVVTLDGGVVVRLVWLFLMDFVNLLHLKRYVTFFVKVPLLFCKSVVGACNLILLTCCL